MKELSALEKIVYGNKLAAHYQDAKDLKTLRIEVAALNAFLEARDNPVLLEGAIARRALEISEKNGKSFMRYFQRIANLAKELIKLGVYQQAEERLGVIYHDVRSKIRDKKASKGSANRGYRYHHRDHGFQIFEVSLRGVQQPVTMDF